MKSKLLIITAMTVLLAVQAHAMAGRPPGPVGPPPDKMLERIVKKLELTEEQRAKMKASAEEMAKELEANRDALKKIAEGLKTEMQKAAPDRARVHDYIAQMNKLRNEMEVKRIDSLLDLKAMLTPEQQEKFKQLLEAQRKSAEKGWRKMKRPGKIGDGDGQGPPPPPVGW
jgi:Spy/CpxP family protein refolding chaperone